MQHQHAAPAREVFGQLPGTITHGSGDDAVRVPQGVRLEDDRCRLGGVQGIELVGDLVLGGADKSDVTEVGVMAHDATKEVTPIGMDLAAGLRSEERRVGKVDEMK